MDGLSIAGPRVNEALLLPLPPNIDGILQWVGRLLLKLNMLKAALLAEVICAMGTAGRLNSIWLDRFLAREPPPVAASISAT